jgi:hypothetical protein
MDETSSSISAAAAGIAATDPDGYAASTSSQARAVRGSSRRYAASTTHGAGPGGFGEQAQPSDVHQEVVDAGHASTESLPERRRLGSRRPVVEVHPGVFGRSAMNHVPRRRRIESRAADPGDFTGASGVASRTPSTPQ